MSRFKNMYIDNPVYVRVKGDESECFKIDGGVRQVCIIFPCLFNVYIDRVMKEGKIDRGRRGVSSLEDGREWRLPGLLYANDLVLCGKSEEDLKVMVEWFAEVCRSRGLKMERRD